VRSPVYRAAPVQTRITDDQIVLTPQQIAELKRQLQAANARLIAIERRQQELRDSLNAHDTQALGTGPLPFRV
jgi:hypothetical protein